MGDIMSQEKWPRAEFEEYLRMEEHDPVETMRRVKQVIGLALMGVEEDMHKEMLKHAPVVGGSDPLEMNAEDGQGVDTRRFYDVVGFDIMLLHVNRGEEEPGELRPYILEVNFNPDPSLYHKEDIGPKGGAWNDIVDLAGLIPGGAPVAAAYTTEELKNMVRKTTRRLCPPTGCLLGDRVTIQSGHPFSILIFRNIIDWIIETADNNILRCCCWWWRWW